MNQTHPAQNAAYPKAPPTAYHGENIAQLARAPEVIVAIDGIEKATEGVKGMLTTLENKINGILSPQAPASPEASPNSMACTPLGGRLRDHLTDLHALYDRLSSIIDRVEV